MLCIISIALDAELCQTTFNCKVVTTFWYNKKWIIPGFFSNVIQDLTGASRIYLCKLN